jgi:hypothetical protein
MPHQSIDIITEKLIWVAVGGKPDERTLAIWGEG